MGKGYFEEVVVGTVLEFGSKTVTKDEIMDFAKKYDPQPFHIDEDAANDSIYGGLIASGWHTGSMAMRLMVDHMVNQRAGLGSPGWDNLKWLKPVRPGDTIRVRSEVVDKKRSKSRPQMGAVFGKIEVFNQHDELVMCFDSIGMVMAETTGE